MATGQVTNERTVDVWRAVPSVFNVKMTGPDGAQPAWPRGPNTMGGYQLDGRKDTLQNQALGAFMDHAQVQSAPSQARLDDIAAFENVLFSSHGAKLLADAVAAGTSPLPDVDPPLNADEQAGKAIFNRSCTLCHGGPGLSTPAATGFPVRYNTIISGCVRPVDPMNPPRWRFKACPPRLARNVRMYEITLADGSVVRKPSSDPGRFLLTGVTPPVGTQQGAPPWFDDWEKFDNAPLRGIARTAPYFTNNSADTLEEVVDHYQALFEFVNVVAPTSPLLTTPTGESRRLSDEDKAPLVAYLKKL
jgi:cytochrome c peroxidase